MKPEPSLPEKIAAITDEGELQGLCAQLRDDGRWNPRLENLVAMRIAEIAPRKNRSTK